MRSSLLLAMLLVFSTAVPALAQSDQDQRAQLHFASGRSYFDEGNYERALEEFQEAYSLRPLSAMLFNIATTQERLNQLRNAADTFERYLREVPGAENADVLARRVVNLRRRAVELDNGRVDPGAVPGTAVTTAPRTGGGGGGDGLVLGGIIGLSVGGAALAVFAITGAMALSAQGSVQSGCYATRSCTPGDVSGMDTLALVSDILWPIGLVAAGVGAVLLVLGLGSSGGDRHAATVLPFATASSGGVLVGGSL